MQTSTSVDQFHEADDTSAREEHYGLLGWRLHRNHIWLNGVGSSPVLALPRESLRKYKGRLVPNLEDPFSLGLLISLVRQKLNNSVVISIGNGWWEVETDEYTYDEQTHESLASALVTIIVGDEWSPTR